MRFKLLIFLSLGLLLWACSPQSPFVRAPFVGVANEPIVQAFDAAAGGVLVVGNGTEIHVPANAFVDESGQVVEGQVTLSYTDIGDPSSILISGIPLHYGKKENPYVMESAGMFDLSAMANGNPLELAEGKSIRTIISSNVEGSQYDFFQLNEEGRTWESRGSVAAVPNPAIDQLNASISAGNEKTIEYDMENCFAFNYGFDLDIVTDEERYKLKDERFNYYTWDTAPALKTLNRLLATKLQGYGVNTFLMERLWKEVTWKGKKYNPNLLVWRSERALPSWIVNSKKYREAKISRVKGDRYRLQFVRYEYQDGVWKDQLDFTTYVTPKVKLEDLYADPAELRLQEYEALLVQMEEEKETLAAQNRVLREFNITQMGVYNYDYIKEEERMLVRAEIYLDGAPLKDQMTDLFVVIKDQNAVLRYGESGLDSFVIYPDQQLFAFMVSEGNTIAVQRAGILDAIDLTEFRNDPSQKLRIELNTSDYVIEQPIDLTFFLDKEMRGIDTESLLTME